MVVEELQQQVTEGSAQREDIIRLKQEGQLLRRELALSGTSHSTKFIYIGLLSEQFSQICLSRCDLQQLKPQPPKPLSFLVPTHRGNVSQCNDRASSGTVGRMPVVL